MLMEVGVPIWPQEKCERTFVRRIPGTMMCAGAHEGGRDACQVSTVSDLERTSVVFNCKRSREDESRAGINRFQNVSFGSLLARCDISRNFIVMRIIVTALRK